MTYVYGCTDRTHPRVEMKHSMRENPTVHCATCGGTMHRIPQPFRYYHNPQDTLFDKLDARYRDYRARNKHAPKQTAA